MKKNRQFLLALMVMVLPYCFTACSKDDNDAPGVPSAIAFSMPDFANSYVYVVMNGDQKVAEICNEYISEFSKDKRATVVYPFDQNGKVDHTKGIVVDNGGTVSWNGAICTYKAGTGALKTLYVESNLISATTTSAFKTVAATPDKLKDGDGNEYKIVKIGNQYWSAENYKCTKDKTGKAIIEGSPDRFMGNQGTDTLFYMVFDASLDPQFEESGVPADLDSRAEIIKDYGLLYNWYAASNIAPGGWALPNNDEWMALRNYLGDTQEAENPVAGNCLKESGNIHWSASNENATNVSGFSAVGAGNFSWLVSGIKTKINMWSSMKDPDSVDYGEDYAYYWGLEDYSSALTGGDTQNDYGDGEIHISRQTISAATTGYSVRLIRK